MAMRSCDLSPMVEDNDVLVELDAMLEMLPTISMDPSTAGSDLSDAFEAANHPVVAGYGALMENHTDAVLTTEEVDALLLPTVFDGDLTGSASADGAGAAVLKSPVNAEKKQQMRAAPYKRRRKRPKDELDYLRGMVDELEAELSALQQPGIRITSEEEDDCEAASMLEQWKHIASHQKKEAGRSMGENTRLRILLEGQLNVAKILKDALEQVQNIARIEVGGGVFPTANRFRALSISDPDVFVALSDKLDEQYLRIADVLRDGGLTELKRDMVKDIELRTSSHGLYFEQVEVRIAPFSMVAVGRAIWRMLSLGALNAHGVHSSAQEIKDDTINATVMNTLQLPSSSNITFKMKFSLRRYREADRIVIVWNGVVEIDGSVSVRLREQGWCQLEPFAMAGRDVSAASISRSTVRVTPEMSDIDSDNDAAHVGEMTNLVIGTYHRNVGLMHQVVENLLMSDMASS